MTKNKVNGWNDYDHHEDGLCDKCGSNRILTMYVKSSEVHEGYLVIGIELGNDNVKIDYCAHCGKIQGKFPLGSFELMGKIK